MFILQGCADTATIATNTGFLLGGLTGNANDANVVVPLDKNAKTQASSLSLEYAKDLIQKWDRDYETLPNEMIFRADKIVYEAYASNVKKWVAVDMGQYRDFNPCITNNGNEVWGGGGKYNKTHFYRVYFICHDRETNDANYINAPDIKTANQIAMAMIRWKSTTLQQRQDFIAGKQFEQIAKKYRSASPKPTVSESIRRFAVMAEDSVNNEQFLDAIDDYESALRIAPWWPQGHYNAALILGKLGYYDEAIDHMKKYLMLAPDAPNARAAQDQIYRWQSEKQARSI